MRPARRLTPDQEAQFLRDGFVILPTVLDRDFCAHHCQKLLDDLGAKADDPATWMQERMHCPNLDLWRWCDQAPPVWEAICDLVGDDRISPEAHFGNGMIVNFKQGNGQPWQPPGPDVGGWHKDGNFFRHFLDSPEQALLIIVIWQDIGPQGGGTFIAPDSVAQIARFLHAHPEGVKPGDFPIGELIHRCRDFRELTGKAGDIVLLHPFMLHAASRNPSGIPRFITNPNVAITAPMRFDRDDPDDFSLLERSILGHLGADRLDWRPTHERERYQPGHLKGYEEYQQKRRQAVG